MSDIDDRDRLIGALLRGPKEHDLVCPACKTGVPVLRNYQYVCPCGAVYSALSLLDAVLKEPR